MKRPQRSPGVVAALILSATVACADSQPEQAGKNTVTYAAAERVTYKEIIPGASAGPLWGDPTKEAHSAFTRFAPAFNAGMHHHSNDLSLVVLRGAYLYRDDAGEKRVGPGEFLRIPGGHRHWSGGDPKEGALFYQHSDAKFDLVPAQ